MHNTLLQQQNNTEKNHFFFTCAVKIIVANARVGSIIAKPASITQVITALSVDWCCFAQCEQNNEKERRGSEGGLHVVCTVGYFLVWKNKMNAWEFVSPGKKRNDVCIGLEEGLKDDCCRRAWMGAVSLSLREEWMCRRKTFVVANAMLSRVLATGNTKIGQSQNRYLVTTWYCAWFFVRSSNHSYTISLHKLRKEELKRQPVAQRSRTNIIRSTYRRIQGPNKSETCTLFDDFFRPPQVDDVWDGAKTRPIQNHFFLETRT